MKNKQNNNPTVASPTHFRFLLAAAGFLVTLCLGTLYAWAIFVPHLEQEFGWTRAEVTIPFTVASLVFAFGMVPVGRLVDVKGPRIMLLLCTVLIVVGYGLSSLTEHLWWLIITFGLIMGAALAAGYTSSVVAGLKWFPDIKGTATGILVGGFGAGAAVFGPMAHFFIGEFGWRQTFLYLGIIFAVVIGATSFIIKNPQPGWRPAGWDPATSKGMRKPSPEYTGYEFALAKMLKTSQFKLMWIHYVLILCGGFGVVVHLKLLALELGFSTAAAVGLVVLIALCNVGGRFIISPLSDLIGRLKSFTIIGSLMSIATLSAALADILNVPGILYFSAIMGGGAFGGYLALSPAFTADMWGMKSVGVNYGAMFTAWGVAAFVGPYFAGLVFDITASYIPAYLTFAFLCIPAIFIASVLVKPSALKVHAVKIGLEKTEMAGK